MQTLFDYLKPTEEQLQEQQDQIQFELHDCMSVTFSCGHTNVIILYGDDLVQSNQKYYMEKFCTCPLCSINRFQNMPQVSFDQALEISGMLELPSLKGHVKGIKEAMIIRAQTLSLSEETMWYIFGQEYRAVQTSFFPFHDFVDRCRWAIDDIYQDTFQYPLIHEEVFLQTDAAWWLARQEYAARELCNNFIRRRSYDAWQSHKKWMKKMSKK